MSVPVPTRRVFVVVEDYDARPEAYDVEGTEEMTLTERIEAIDGYHDDETTLEHLRDVCDGEDVAAVGVFVAASGEGVRDNPDPLLKRIEALASLAKRKGNATLKYPLAMTQPDPYVVVKRERPRPGTPHPQVDYEVWGGTIPDANDLTNPGTTATLYAECTAEHIADTVAQGLNAAFWASKVEEIMGLPPGLMLDDLIRKGRETAWQQSFETGEPV